MMCGGMATYVSVKTTLRVDILYLYLHVVFNKDVILI